MQFLVVLIVVAQVVKFWWLIAAVVGMFCAAHWTRRAVDHHAERVAAERRRVAGLVVRADQEHACHAGRSARHIRGISLCANVIRP
jgi:hypothetical protein